MRTRNIDSKVRAPRFDCFKFEFHGEASATFATVSAISGCEQPQQQSLFDHLVGAGERPVWNLEAERLGRVEVDHQLELGRAASLLAKSHALAEDVAHRVSRLDVRGALADHNCELRLALKMVAAISGNITVSPSPMIALGDFMKAFIGQ